jgi:hypothetical protein|tara:strand:- start:4830 stop:4985 length:156 start_codon:yes stop_codon:yes gene_type:complete
METTEQILEDIKNHIDDMPHEEYFTPTGKLLVKAFAHLYASNLKKQNDGIN